MEMTKEEIKEGKYLGEMCRILYTEYYLPNCVKENKIPIKSVNFFMSVEFMQIIKSISKEKINEINKRLDNFLN